MIDSNLAGIIDLLKEASDSGIKLSLDNDKLLLHMHEEKEIDELLLDKLKENKEYLIAYFKTYKAGEADKALLAGIQPYDRESLLRVPLSFSQERLWFIDQLEGSSAQYHVPAILHLKGALEKDALEYALHTIVSRHEVLRTVITAHEGIAYQHIQPADAWQLTTVDDDAYRNNKPLLQSYIQSYVAAPFDLQYDYMLRAQLIVQGVEDHTLVIVIHHIASDGWSTGIIVQELVELYRAALERRPAQLPSLDIQYADYAVWQRNYLSEEVLDKKIRYWKDKLTGAATLQLPVDFTRPVVQSTRGDSKRFQLSKELSDKIQALSLKQETTLFMTLLAAFKVLLYRYSGQEDICVGTLIAGRTQQETEGLIGFFLNSLTLRSDLSDNPSFISLLEQVKQTTLGAYENQDVPFEKVVEAVVKERDLSRNPLYQVQFVLQNVPEEPALQLGDLQLTLEEAAHITAPFDLTLSMEETPEGLSGQIVYCADLFNAATIERLMVHFELLLEDIVETPAQQVGALNMLTSKEAYELLVEFNDTQRAYPSGETIPSLISVRSRQTPEATAIISGDTAVSFLELEERSNQLAHYLRAVGVKEDTLVPLCIERGPEMIIGILGIWKAGGAYVPVDPEYPAARIGYMLEDCRARAVVTSTYGLQKLPHLADTDIIALDGGRVILNQQKKNFPVTAPLQPKLSYVIYTSGSTGKPKGVMVEHRGMLNHLYAKINDLHINERTKLAFTASYTFDISVWQMFAALVCGGQTIIYPEELIFQPEQFIRHIDEDRITILELVPSYLAALLREDTGITLPHLEYLMVTGEAVSQPLLQQWFEHPHFSKIPVVNAYGPTEASDDICHHIMHSAPAGANVPLGKPVQNLQLYVLNTALQLCPVGVAGEICVSGIGVSRGYLNREALTAEKFIRNPFNPDGAMRMYRTGDLGRWLPDGTIEYLGRIDEQVKIRGFRIELGEIESVLLQCPLVNQAVVLAKADKDGIKKLVGYIVPEGPFLRDDIIHYLEDKLPEFMIPSLLMEMEKLPLTANGKINRQALPDPDMSLLLTTTWVAPRNATEKQLADIWQQLLNLERVGIYDNFFNIGGHSLLAMRLVAAIRREMNTELTIKSLFLYPTIAGLADLVQAAGEGLQLPPVEAAERPEHIPLSYSQERLWFIDQLEEGSTQYHLPAILHLRGKLNKTALAFSIQGIIARHEVLRTVIDTEGGVPYQRILEASGWEMPVIDEQDAAAIQTKITTLVNIPFDLAADYMLRANLIVLGEEEHILVVVIHHIASDLWSAGIIIKELTERYAAYAEDRFLQQEPLPLQYADYAIWERTWLTGDILDKKLAYWKDKLSGVTTLNLPTDHLRPVIQSTRGAGKKFVLDRELSEQLKTLSYQQGTTLFMTLLAAFKVLLYRYSGQEDICVGSPIAGRTQRETEVLIGFFVNTLALRSYLGGDPSFLTLLEQVKQTTLSAYDHQEVPFEKVVEVVVAERSLSRTPLFQVMFDLQSTPEEQHLHLHELEVVLQQAERTTAQFDLNFSISDSEAGISGDVSWCVDLFTEATIDRMIRHYETLLRAVAASPASQISGLNLLTPAETQQLLYDFNDTAVPYPAGKTFVDLFAAQVAATPEAIALVFEDRQLTYQELDEQTNRLAHYLISKGVVPDTLVPVCIERSINMIVAVLGILKAGGAYVPVDPESPAGRISYMLADSNAKLIVTSRYARERIPAATAADFVILDEEDATIAALSSARPSVQPAPHHLAYMIYTSGSTGRPKGVLVEHLGMLNHLLAMVSEFEMNSTSVVAFTASYTFDISVWQMLNAFICGGRTIIYSQQLILHPAALIADADRRQVTLLQLVPSYLTAVLHEHANVTLRSVRYLLVTGEAVTRQLLQEWFSHPLFRTIPVVNAYGPAEASDDVSFYYMYEAPAAANIPVGAPIQNLQIYILDKQGQLCPLGIPGEICVSGIGVARGYLNLEELTAQKFVADPFRSGQRMYKTGDLGKWLPDGNIEFLGRMDDQVKIRGHRIELGEVESVIAESGQVQQVVAVAKPDHKGLQRLVAYLVPDADYDKGEMLAFLKERLPEYMLPVLVELNALPLTPNGKIDKHALPEPAADGQLAHQYVAPRNRLEQVLINSWQELLGVHQIGIYDNFFQLGGHSLMAMRLMSVLFRETGTELPVKRLFLYPTVAELAAYVQQQSPDKSRQLPVVEALPRPHRVPLSYSQERLWFIDQLEGSIHYHITEVLRLKGNLNTEALAYALQTIVQRHEVLRTVIREEKGVPYQRILDRPWELAVTDEPLYKKDKGALQAYVQSLVEKPFDLSADHMLRAHLIAQDNNEYVLALVIHHIASDAWSAGIIVNEVMELYAAYTEERTPQLPPMHLQFADYAIWQRNYLTGDVLEHKLAYWKEKLSGVAPLDLPTDFARPATQTTRGSSILFSIDKTLSDQLSQLAQQEGATLYMTLLAAFKVLLYRYSHQTDISVGCSAAARPQPEIENLIGFFINTLALRSDLSDGPDFRKLLQQVKETTLDAYNYQDVPFEKVVETVVKDRDPSRSPLFQTMFVMQNVPGEEDLKLGEVIWSGEDVPITTAKFDLTFFVADEPAGLHVNAVYKSDLFKEETIARMGDHYVALLQAIVANPSQTIDALPMLSAAEEKELQAAFHTTVPYPLDKTFADLFNAQVTATPEATALVFEDIRLTYQQLNERADQLAHYLHQQGVQPGTLVPLYVERSAAMIVGILGIIKAGAAYVPIDPDFPADRVAFILEDTRAQLLVSDKPCKAKLSAVDIPVITLDGDETAITLADGRVPATLPAPDDVVYVIYTSGSTGKPKGVTVTHRNLMDYIFGLRAALPLQHSRSFGLLSSIATDLGNTVLFPSLLSGGSLHLFSKEMISDGELLGNYFAAHPIDCIKIVASHWRALSADGRLLLPEKLLIFGGEALETATIHTIRAAGWKGTIVNHYGPTETTIGKLLHVVNDDTPYGHYIPVGRPFSNTRLYVLNDAGRLCPAGVPGELYIGGDGVATGYLYNETLTAGRFVDDPFIAGSGKLYRTGDLVKVLPDGNLLFAGRADDQVKIRGYRVELGEVEKALLQRGGISQAVVVARGEDSDSKRLIGYLTVEDTFDQESIDTWLEQHLPDYMIPSALVVLDSFPLLANGKVDRKALPDPALTVTGDGYVAPETPLQQVLAKIWGHLLEVEEPGIQDDFFALGGHSLLAIRVVSAIRKELGVEVAIGDIFDYPTIALLSGRLSAQTDMLRTPQLAAGARPALIPLSYGQERLWFIHQLEGSVQYHVPMVLRMKGALQPEALAYALRTTINRHEVLRTVFVQQHGTPYQHIMGPDKWELGIIDGEQYADDPAALKTLITALTDRPFDLTTDHLLRAQLITLPQQEFILVLTLHHLVSDEWSHGIMLQEFLAHYAAFVQGATAQLPDISVQYADYAIWQRKYLSGEVLARKLAYWKEKLEDVTVLNLPADFTRPAVQSNRGALRSYAIGKETTAHLLQLSQEQGTTLFMTLLAAFKVLLHRYTGQTDICVGTPVSGRTQQEVEGLIGFFVNTLALRSDLSDNPSFTALLQEVRTTLLRAYDHQDVPFEKIVETVVKHRDLSSSPVFQVMFVWETKESGSPSLSGVQLTPEASEHTSAKFDLTFFVSENDGGLQVNIEYCTDLFREDTIRQLFAHFEQLLRSITLSPAERIDTLPLFGEEERRYLLSSLNDTAVKYPAVKSLPAMFAAQVASNPGGIAVVLGGEQLCYRELDERSGKLAAYLRNKGVTAGTLVPVCIERSLNMIVGIWGVLKAGGAYVPVDPEYPEARIRYMITDTAGPVILSSSSCAAKVKLSSGADIIEIDKEWATIGAGPVLSAEETVTAPVAYVIYTSGTTGNPKGVEMPSSAMINLLQWQQGQMNTSLSKRILQFASLNFDVSFQEIFSALCLGHTLFLIEESTRRDAGELLRQIRHYRINYLFLPYVVLKSLADYAKAISLYPASLEIIFTAGEQLRLSADIKALLDNTGATLYNHYGPTEAHVVSSYEVAETDFAERLLPPIGKPISNTSLYILDSRGELCGRGIPGELYIGGVQVANGYLHQPELTAKKFLADPFSAHPKARMYRTGDLARWLPDGNIEYLGRIDDQVKIRGYRIELGEVESALQQCPLVNQAVVLAKADNNGFKRLVAYIVPEGSFDKDAIRLYLNSRLPEYMVPSLLVKLDKLPLTANGKVNKRALPDPAADELLTSEYLAPRNEKERQLVNIWQQLLNVERVGIKDNFFELGGHSLLTMRLISEIREVLQIEVPVGLIFQLPTIEGLSRHLQLHQQDTLTPAKDVKTFKL
ncbi:non-ribosomal peptide synthetase [Chitinophaga qingshengii]|uniref:Amino acid adenylation domain-containing protein n=1 Tax=Chitinophaga qingshengii TaxID=1569794 RepID=A0ABR7TGV5_9BACT|nr:non-ribosomal peptide synthetase [Chitinophaga qingshengii]MBC9929148.1 amino acid adenylation domain-containing protein [Chitinophaga qingshengii]